MIKRFNIVSGGYDMPRIRVYCEDGEFVEVWDKHDKIVFNYSAIEPYVKEREQEAKREVIEQLAEKLKKIKQHHYIEFNVSDSFWAFKIEDVIECFKETYVQLGGDPDKLGE